MNIYDADIIGSYMMVSLSYSVWNYWGKGELNINTYFSLTGWMLCVITHIIEDSNDN